MAAAPDVNSDCLRPVLIDNLPELRTNRRVRAFLDHAYAAFGAGEAPGGA